MKITINVVVNYRHVNLSYVLFCNVISFSILNGDPHMRQSSYQSSIGVFIIIIIIIIMHCIIKYYLNYYELQQENINWYLFL